VKRKKNVEISINKWKNLLKGDIIFLPETIITRRLPLMAMIPQINFFDYSEIEKLGDLERLTLAFAGIDDEALMRKLERVRGNGRDEYPVRVMWNFFIAMKVFGHNTIESFRRELSRNSQLRKICGLYDYEHGKRKHLVPPARVFTGFLKKLAKFQSEADKIFEGQTFELFELLPGFGETMAGDGKYIDSYAKGKAKEQTATDNRTENDAEWSVKEYHYTDSNGNGKVKKEYHFGFKAHIICDVGTELPMAFSVTAANTDEKKEMQKLLECPLISENARKGAIKHMLLDRGYDSTEMIKRVKGMGIAPVTDIRNCWKDGEATKQYKDTDIVYNYRGDVFYAVTGKDEKSGGSIVKYEKMKYAGYDRQKKCLRYSHEGKIHKIYISYDERVFLPTARDSYKFKKLYKGRTAIERLNGRLDGDYMFENHCIRGLEKMTLMVSLSMIVMNGMALGKIKSGKKGLRSLKTAA
jgi:hypothetical protein